MAIRVLARQWVAVVVEREVAAAGAGEEARQSRRRRQPPRLPVGLARSLRSFSYASPILLLRGLEVAAADAAAQVFSAFLLVPIAHLSARWLRGS